MRIVRDIRLNALGVLFLLVFNAMLIAACGEEPLPAAGRPDFPQPTFMAVEVTPPPISPTATPWPSIVGDGVRVLPAGLDPWLYSEAPPEEVVALWEQFLTGSTTYSTSGRFFFRNRRGFEGEIHLCPGGTGYLAGDPEGALKWKVNPSAGRWYEVTLTHEIPFTGRDVTFAIGVHDGQPARSGSTTPMEFRASDRCALAEASIQYAFTADERKLDEKVQIVSAEIDEIPWVDGTREFPSQITVEGSKGLDQDLGAAYWSAFLSGGVLDAVAFNYASYSVTQAFAGSLHLCDERVAVLEGDPSGIGEWAIQATGSNPYDAKIIFTLPGDPTFRTIVLGVDGDSPVRMGRDEDTGLIGATPLVVTKSSECGESTG
jgi:hypothetical protein